MINSTKKFYALLFGTSASLIEWNSNMKKYYCFLYLTKNQAKEDI